MCGGHVVGKDPLLINESVCFFIHELTCFRRLRIDFNDPKPLMSPVYFFISKILRIAFPPIEEWRAREVDQLGIYLCFLFTTDIKNIHLVACILITGLGVTAGS